VRGTTSREIIMMAREAGAKKVYFASASPPVRFANVYGIDMPSRSELIASFRSDEEICQEIGADALVYQDIEDLKAAVQALNPSITQFETSCFDGHYVTGDVTSDYLQKMENERDKPATNNASRLDSEDCAEDNEPFEQEHDSQLDLNLSHG